MLSRITPVLAPVLLDAIVRHVKALLDDLQRRDQ